MKPISISRNPGTWSLMTSWGIIATHFCFFEVCTGVELNDIKSLPAVIAETEKDLRSMKNTGILRNLPQD